MEAFLRKTLSGWEPSDEPSREVHRKHKLGESYRADIVKPRSYQSHKLCMALIDLTYSNLPEKYHRSWPTPRVFRRMLADAVGFVEEFYTRDGEKRTMPLSLSYSDLPDEVEFQKVFMAMMTVCAHLLDIENIDTLSAEVSRYADENYR